jgi:uridine kinase
MSDQPSPIVIGIAGGTGSGKTTVANVILRRLGADKITFLPHDSYYRDLGELTIEERQKINFDHPDALETELLIKHIQALKRGETVDVPIYDFTTHTRTDQTLHIESQSVILVEGILIFADETLLTLFDAKIFVDTPDDIRFIRRLQRDLLERGRTVDSVIQQYMTTVRPMHLEFVEPSKRQADVIIPEGGHNTVAMDMVVARIGEMLAKQ